MATAPSLTGLPFDNGDVMTRQDPRSPAWLMDVPALLAWLNS